MIEFFRLMLAASIRMLLTLLFTLLTDPLAQSRPPSKT